MLELEMEHIMIGFRYISIMLIKMNKAKFLTVHFGVQINLINLNTKNLKENQILRYMNAI